MLSTCATPLAVPLAGSLTASRSDAPAWSPLDLAPVLWLDATVAASIEKSAGVPAAIGESVAIWKDQSGNGYDLVQSLDANDRPTHTANGISFDGSDDYLTTYGKVYAALGGFTANTVFAVVRINTAVTNKTIADTRGSGVRGNPNLHYASSVLSLCGQGQLPKVPIAAGVWFAFCVRHADSFRGVSVNSGAESQNTSAATLLATTNFAIGGNGAIPSSGCARMDLKEMIVIPSNVTDSTVRAKVMQYLALKHSLAIAIIAGGATLIAAGFELAVNQPLV